MNIDISNPEKLTGLGYEYWLLVNKREFYINSILKPMMAIADEEWIEARKRMTYGRATEEDFKKWGKYK